MKRIVGHPLALPKGILAAGIIAASTCCHGQTNVYSLSIPSYSERHWAGMHHGELIEFVWSANTRLGIVGAEELTSWTDPSGRPIPYNRDRPDRADDREHKRTIVFLGNFTMRLPFPASWAAAMAATILMAGAVIISLFLFRRGRSDAGG